MGDLINIPDRPEDEIPRTWLFVCLCSKRWLREATGHEETVPVEVCSCGREVKGGF